MSSKDRLEIRNWVKNNPGVHPKLREFFEVLDRDLKANNVWSTTTTTTSTTTTTTSSTTTSSSTTTTTSSSTTTTTE
jgi:hypothetical protein